MVGLSRDDTIANLKPRDIAPDTLHDPQIAVPNPARIVRRARNLCGALVVAPIGSDLESRYLGLDPDVVWFQRARVERMFFDTEVSWTVEHGNFHGVATISGIRERPDTAFLLPAAEKFLVRFFFRGLTRFSSGG